MERLYTLIQTKCKVPDFCDLNAFKKSIKYLVFMTIVTIYIIIVINANQPNQTLLSKFMPTRANHSPADLFYPCIAVIVDSRAVDHLIAIVHNVNHHIPSTWPIQIFHGTANENFIRNSTLAPLIASGKIFLSLLMTTVRDRGGTDILLTDPKLWQRVRGEKILLFQMDSVMCSNSPHKITDFLQYDYVGAPWDLWFFTFDKNYRVGNGGFSLRTRSKILALLALVPYNPKIPEDVWYAQNMHRVNGSIPSIEIAKTFAVESMYYDRPVGVHRFPWNCKFRADIARTCPESMLIMADVCH